MKTFVVIGLGRFGNAVATELCTLGHEVLAIDADPEKVQKVVDLVTHAVTQRIDAHIEAINCHPMEIRRYYRRLDY